MAVISLIVMFEEALSPSFAHLSFVSVSKNRYNLFIKKPLLKNFKTIFQV